MVEEGYCNACGEYRYSLMEVPYGHDDAGAFYCHRCRSVDDYTWVENFAYKKHSRQKTDDGRPYIQHLRKVVNILKEVTTDEDIISAGWLHDTIEDTDTTVDELSQRFNERIANLVYEMTHEGKKDNYGYYFPRLKSKEAIMIKFADRLANMSDMECWDEERQNHFLKRSKFWKDGSDKIKDGKELKDFREGLN